TACRLTGKPPLLHDSLGQDWLEQQRRAPHCLSDWLTHLEQLPRRHGPGSACAETPEALDYSAYLALLKNHGHNFIRLWRWEQFKSQAAGGSYHLCMTPQPWPRTSARNARDGKPKFDLDSFDPEYFDRLLERVEAAGKEGIYVAVMLFEGWA